MPIQDVRQYSTLQSSAYKVIKERTSSRHSVLRQNESVASHARLQEATDQEG